ncbi:MAG: gliding motility-associated ABC transporter substrate-binding protein GldG [Flavobacterium sp.]|jgi:gliding-associated putative ABC transporter substrate-binding component GldG|uniref:gliding motility-associated ABC transporter substrate-binding protein GldG n=1 Tax=Flavobacterium sp. TaxID=239 RepID=UPI001B724B96|nr:gliding motility-associated ABC transporter substrate-binding protein GldG [Flavobacterium sp.]MBP6146885.1 gliding motility-associated ABC transporter substrate-binding protein GldG [Flavobacterium sp.]MBP7183332.1 gliding motility-associated ABC transporter substrate-binding protein GldG [Flavobacterium sp.]MBP7317115.1 gliding motility-associated ABC transporter substrate-binding protein GldG [Flavobacterium sp.]MBP8887116.1 gliding motility-associated ABC transporter substrate-binding pr
MTASKKNNLKSVLIILAVVLLLNAIGNSFFHRFDLTQDKRYTLSPTSLNIIKQVQNPLYIKVYMQGDLPAEFKRLQLETKQLLEEFQAYNSNIVFEFVDPLENEDASMDNIKELYRKGLTPINITVDDKGKQSQAMVFPWAIAIYDNKEVNIPLLKNIMGASTTQKVIGSVQHLEYSIAEGLNKITKAKQKKIAVIKGNGELQDILMAKFLLQVRESYHIGPFTLDSVAKSPVASLKALEKYDLAVIAKPTETFSDAEKQVLDQFIINGGKTLWLIDQVTAEMDSLYDSSGTTLAYPKDLNLNDMFFKYGIRINPDLVKDEQGSPIKLATGEQGSATQFQEFNWKFAPQVYPNSLHPIVKNLGGIKFDFANSIDTLKNGIKKTILLQSSQYSKKIGTPSEISLNSVVEETSPRDYANKGKIPLAVLLEGSFHSMFENRVLPFEQKTFQATGKENKMIVISDGDLIKNQLDKNFQPVELGYDQRSGNLYDNKDFLINCVNYLLDDTGLINIRSKDLDLPLLDKEKVYENYTRTQLITIGLPIVILLFFGVVFTFLRKRKYSK